MSKTARIGMGGYARILRSIIDRPATKISIVRRGLCGRTAAGRIVSAFHVLGLVHVCTWRSRADVAYQPVYAIGAKPDAPAPTHRSNGRPVKAPPHAAKPGRAPAELLAFHTLIEALQAPCTVNDIAAEAGVERITAKRLVTALHEARLVHVCDWRRSIKGGRPAAVYVWAQDANDVPCPPSSRTDINRRWRHNRKMRRLPMFFIPSAGAQA
jgi:hypothetical protein